MSGIYMLIQIIIVIANYHVADQIDWLLHALMFLSLSILILIVHAALQEKLHECVGWFITSSICVSDTTTLVATSHHISLSPTIIK